MLVYNTLFLSVAAVASLLFSSVASRPTAVHMRRAVVQAHNATLLSNISSLVCTSNYTVREHDVCLSIAATHNITVKNILTLNPSINANCTNLQIGSTLCLMRGNSTLTLISTVAVGNSTGKVVQLASNATAVIGSISADGWTFHKLSKGASFFNDFSFYGDLVPGGADPTHGAVTYVGASEAWSSNLVNASDDKGVLMTIDQTAGVPIRRSTRIHSNDVYNVGTLIILDAFHIPAGNGLWPAFWTVGQNWPNNGEIDILEYVNLGQMSQSSFHTGPGCTMGTTGMLNTSNIVGGTYCSSADTGNAGCGVTTTALAGDAFNNATGGVYALVWTTTGISVHFWKRSDIPVDVAAQSPNPSTWGTPMAFVSSDNCNLSTAFKDHSIVFDLTTCGDWAGSAFSGSTGYGIGACEQYMQNADLSQAYWNVNSVQVFLKNP